MNVNSKQIVIVTGGGRCGTLFFGEHLQTIISDCASVHEPDILYWRDPEMVQKIRQFGPYQSIFGKLIRRRGLRVLSVQAASHQLSEEEVLRRLRKQRDDYFRSFKSRTVVEANAAWWGLTQYASRLGFPARVICIIRDPFSWIQSWQQHGGLHDRRDLVATFRLGRLKHPGWSADPILRLAHTWMNVYGHLHESCEYRDNHRMFRFEDVFSVSREPFESLLDFAANDQPERVNRQCAHALRRIPSNASQKINPELSSEQREAIGEICAPLAEKYGYSNQ